MPNREKPLHEKIQALKTLPADKPVPSHLKVAVQSAKKLRDGDFVEVLQVLEQLGPLCMAKQLRIPFAVIVLAELILSRFVPNWTTALDIANPLATLGDNYRTFDQAVRGSFIHTINKRTDTITRCGHIIIRVMDEGPVTRVTLFLIAFLRSLGFAKWLAKRVCRGMQSSDLLHLLGAYKRSCNPYPAKRFLPPRFLRTGVKQKYNTDLSGYTLSDVVGAAAEYAWNHVLPEFFNEETLYEALGATRFHRGRNLMMPHMAGFFAEWNLWRDGVDLENTALGPNTLKFQRACSLDQDGIQTNFRKYINLCRDQLSPFHFAELHAMTTNELKAMQCKVVCVVCNFGGKKISNWRSQEEPKWVQTPHETKWRKV